MLCVFLPCEHYAAIIMDMGERISIAEIQSRFQSEWVLLEDPQTDESLDVKSGKILYHSKDRDEVYRKAIELHPRRFAMLFTGMIPENTAVVLCAFHSMLSAA